MPPQTRKTHRTTQLTNHPRTFSTSIRLLGTSFGSAKRLPRLGRDGMYHITTEEEYRAILEDNADKLIILKVFSPWCKTCKAMAPKFQALAKRVDNMDAPVKPPIVWVSLAHSKEIGKLIKSELGVSAVPSVVFHAGDGVVVDSFRCGPAKVATVLRPKLAELIANHVDHSSGTLKSLGEQSETSESASQPTEQGWNIRSKWQNFLESHHTDGHHDSRSLNSTLTTEATSYEL